MTRFFTIERPGPGTLSTMGRPVGDERLPSEMSRLAAAGVGGLVSLLTHDEAARLGLANEPLAAADAGIEYLSVPIPDATVPVGDLREASSWVRAMLSSDVHVIAHCRAGIGRSSMMAAAVMVDEGMSPDQVWAAIERARGCRVPDTAEQRAWLSGRHT
jgi:protein-tyrosine phosphatase